MRSKRITAAILSFILFMGNPMSAFATQTAGGMEPVKTEYALTEETSTTEGLVEAETSATETTEADGENEEPSPEETTGEEVYEETSEEVTSEEENSHTEATESEETSEELTATEELTTVEELTTIEETSETTEALENEVPGVDAEYFAIVENAKEALEELVKEKDIFAIVYLTDAYAAKEKPDTESETVATLPSAKTVQVLDVEVQWKYEEDYGSYLPVVWFVTQFYEGESLQKGYIEESNLVYSDELLLQWKKDYSMLFPFEQAMLTATSVSYADVYKFPVSYQAKLKKLKNAHPNWTFVPMNVNRDWDDCIDEQEGNYSWIYYNQPAAYRAGKINSTWYYASRAGIEYYMDPRNFLTESNIFQFEQNTYNASYHTVSALQSFLNGTFMSGKVPGDSSGRTYATVIWNSGKTRGLSPFNLAARVIQEQGKNGTSAMISGTYSGYKGYYNHYNISASGTTDAQVLRNGLAYAKKMGWNTRTKSLEGGAAFIGNGYILQGQDTLYLQKFDIEHGSSSLHQYMQNIMAPYTEGRSMKSMYDDAGSLNSNFVFKIPVFDNMPQEYSASHSSMRIEKGNTKKLTIYCSGSAMSGSDVTFVSSDKKVATVATNGTITAVGSGNAVITATIKADTDIKFTCKVEVYAPLKAITLTASDTELFLQEGLPDKVPVLGEDGITTYVAKAKCPGEAILDVEYNPTDTTDDRTVTWTVADESVLTLQKDATDISKATVTAVGGGTTTVKAKVGKFEKSVEITVRVPMSEAALKLDSNTLTLYRGETKKVNVFYQPYNTTDFIDPEWYSDNEKVAVIEDGNIKAVGAGTTKLHAAVGPFDGSQSALTCTVTVKEYQVSFLNEDGTTLLTVSGEYGKSLEYLQTTTGTDIPWKMTKEGYYFAGWYTKAEGKGKAVTKDTILYGSMELYPFFVEDNGEEATVYVKPIGDLEYTGAYLKPSVQVYDKATLLKKGTDYTVSYRNNRNVNKDSDSKQPTVVITGKGRYVGKTWEAEFDIVPKDISHEDVLTDNLLADYTGRLQKLQPTLTDGKRILQKNTDYVLEYPETDEGAYKEPGTYEVVINGVGNYEGTRSVYVMISKRVEISDVKITLASKVPYNNGNAFVSEETVEVCEPKVTVTYDGNTLKEETDYVLSYANNKEIGTASVTILGKGIYVGSLTKYFEITGTALSTVSITGISDAEYTGETVLQTGYKLTDKTGKVLVENADYTVTYQENLKTGRAAILFTGIHGYTGSVKKTFQVLAYDIGKNKLTYQPEAAGESGAVSLPAFAVQLKSETVEYDKNGAKPEVLVTFKGEALKEGRDYTLSYKNHYRVVDSNAEEKPMVIITGKGNFTGKLEQEFVITSKDIAKTSIQVSDVKFRNRKGFCFIEPIIKDGSGRRLMAGTDYEEEVLYTYGTDVVLYDKTIRLAGEKVLEEDIPTPGELEDAEIIITVAGKGNYTGSISASYKIIENTSWFDEWLDTEETEESVLKVNRSVMYLDPLYPEQTDTIKLGVEVGELLSDRTEISCESEVLQDALFMEITDGKLTVAFTKSREELSALLTEGNYTLSITPVILLNGEEVTLDKRMITVRIYKDTPQLQVETVGSIDLLHREETSVMLTVDFSSSKDTLAIPTQELTMEDCYKLTGEGAQHYYIEEAASSFENNQAKLCLKAKETATFMATTTEEKEVIESDTLGIAVMTQKGVALQTEVTITPIQSDYQVTPYTETCYIKTEEGTGQLLYTSDPSTLSFEDITCDVENVEVGIKGKLLQFSVENAQAYGNESELPLTVFMKAKGAAVNAAPKEVKVCLVFCEETELEKLIGQKDTTEKTLEERREVMTSYEETKAVNAYDKKMIAENTVDFSDVKIAFLGDSITEGGGLEKLGVDEYVYTTIVERALKPEAVYRLGYGGKSISYYWDSLMEDYEKIPQETDIIFVFAGINDVYAGNEKNFGSLSNLSQSKTFCGDTYSFMTKLQTRYPDAKIIFLTPLSTITNTWYKEMLPDMLPMQRYVDAIKVIGQKTNVEVWDLYNANLLDSYDENVLSEYMYDGVHPGAGGHRVLGEHIASELIRMKILEQSKE